jgi:IS30 family transposase
VAGDTGHFLIRQEGVATMAYHQLTQEQRYLIVRSKVLGKSIREIAQVLGRSPSTISRELRRNLTPSHHYCVEKAHSYATARRRRCRRGSHFSEAVFHDVDLAIRQRLSPEQIVGVFSRDGKPVPSHETIYRHIRRNKRQGGNLVSFTRIMSKVGRKRYRSRPARGVLHGKRHISERPACVNDRSRIGDWEGDTVMGKDTKHCLMTLVERKSGFTIIRLLQDRTTRAVTDAALEVIRRSEHTFNTITFDNGTEFHDYKQLEKDGGPTCYFATPYHSWERGTNENTNGLIRQYLPKGKCLANVSQAQCDWIADQLNQRPRKRLRFQTPEWIYQKSERSVALAS